jgi:hypothetical protein
MALTGGTLYVCLTSWTDQFGSFREGQIVLGSKLDASHETLVVALGSTPQEIEAAQRAIRVTGSSLFSIK